MRRDTKRRVRRWRSCVGREAIRLQDCCRLWYACTNKRKDLAKGHTRTPLCERRSAPSSRLASPPSHRWASACGNNQFSRAGPRRTHQLTGLASEQRERKSTAGRGQPAAMRAQRCGLLQSERLARGCEFCRAGCAPVLRLCGVQRLRHVFEVENPLLLLIPAVMFSYE